MWVSVPYLKLHHFHDKWVSNWAFRSNTYWVVLENMCALFSNHSMCNQHVGGEWVPSIAPLKCYLTSSAFDLQLSQIN